MKQLLTLLIALLIATPAFAQQKREEAKNKAGALYYTHSGSSYVLHDNTANVDYTGTGNIVGPAFFYERIILSRFTVGVTYSSMLERSMDIKTSTATVNVVENITMTTFDFKAYFKDHRRPGWKPYLGVSFGTMAVADTLSVTTTGTTTATEEETKATVPVTFLRAGMDLTMGFGGVRIDFGQATGSRRDLESSTNYRAKYVMDGSSLAIGVFSHF